jgi:hypothetical protein
MAMALFSSSFGEYNVLVQPEMEGGRFPLVCDPPYRARSLSPHMPIGLNFRIPRDPGAITSGIDLQT